MAADLLSVRISTGVARAILWTLEAAMRLGWKPSENTVNRILNFAVSTIRFRVT